jgi:uncharacterized membrane protein
MKESENEKETDRIEAFSDGVFAFAITLLALDLKVPQIGKNVDSHILLLNIFYEWPSFLGFIISFISILIMWVNHHGIFKHICKINANLMFANGFMLLLVITVPFTTSMLAEYYLTPSSYIAAAFYTGSFVLINVSYNLLWAVATQNRTLLKSSVSEKTVKRLRRNYILGFPAYMLAFAISFVSVELTIAICFGLWIFWAIMIK